MSTIIVNTNLAELFISHEIAITQDEEFIYPDLPIPIKLKARSVYQEVNSQISSQLDVLVITPDGINIVESFGDFGADLDEAIRRNFQNFSISCFHTLLVAFGYDDQAVIESIDIEEWKIGEKKWTAYIGNISPKSTSELPDISAQTSTFFSAIENGIRSQTLTNNYHWFRGYYMQHNDKIALIEFIIDNNPSTAIDEELYAIPVIPNIKFCSCRIFIFLRLGA